MDHARNTPEAGQQETDQRSVSPSVHLLRAPLSTNNVLSVFDNEFWRNSGRNQLKRSVSTPGEITPDFNERRKNWYPAVASPPEGRPSDWNKEDTYNDQINDVKDTNLSLNPLATYRRAPVNFNYLNPNNAPLPNDQRTNPTDAQRKSRTYPNAHVTGKVLREPAHKEPINCYGTYRRAPRTNDFRRHAGSVETGKCYQNPVYEPDISERIHEISTSLNNTVDDTEIDSNNHKPVNKQSSLKHLFSMKLNDIKKNNLHETEKDTKRHRVSKYIESKRRRFIEFLNSKRNRRQPREGFLSRSRKRLRKLSRTTSDGSTGEDKDPFIYFRLVTQYPKACFCITLSGHVLVVIVTMLLLLSGFDLFPTDFEVLPINDYNVPWRKRDLAWKFRDQYEDRYIRKWDIHGLDKWPRSMAYGRANIVLYYDKSNGNIFKKSCLKRMEYIENYIFQQGAYSSSYCVLTSKMKCSKPTSILRLFDGTYAFLDPIFNDTEYNNIPGVLYAAMTNNITKSEIAYFLSKDHHITPKSAYAHVTRTIIPIGYPLKLGEKKEPMEIEMERFLLSMKPTFEYLVKSSSELRLTYWSYLLFRQDLIKQASSDLLLTMGSITFIFGFVVYHTKSLWVSFLAVASILTSFLGTNLIYRIILDYRYFGHFHIIAIFIILGIGADDLFVFLDVWKMTEFKKYKSLAHRLSDAYTTSVLSMFFTSLTTTVAFFASSISPQLAIKSFGVFAGMLVIVNYISVIIYFPTVVIMHHVYFQNWSWPCSAFLCHKFHTVLDFFRNCCQRQSTDKHKEQHRRKNSSLFEDNTAVGSAGNVYEVVGEINPTYKPDHSDEYGFLPTRDTTSEQKQGPVSILVDRSRKSITQVNGSLNREVTEEGVCNGFHEIDLGSQGVTDSDSVKAKKKILVHFFTDYYFKFVTNRWMRWVIILVLLGVVAFFAYSVSNLDTDGEQIQFYKKSHNYGRAMDFELHGFVASKADRNVVVYIVWGLLERDMEGCHFSDGRCLGVQRYDSTFDPNTPEAQLALRNICHKLLNFNDREIDHYKIRRDFATGEPEILCFADGLDTFLKEESRTVGINRNLPWGYRKTIEFMQSKSSIYTTARFNSSFNEFLEIPISYWLNDGYRFKNMKAFHKFHSLIGEEICEYSTPLKNDFSVFYGNNIKYLGIQVNLTLGTFSTGYAEGRPVMDRWEEFVRSEVKKMPKGLQGGFQLTKDFWHTVSLQKSMRDNAIFGIVIGIGLAFPILTVATKNVVIGFFATFCMCCSTICVIGVIPLAGWKLGVLESLNMCMVVGLTVDYVVHLAEGYHISKNTDRMLRTQDMLRVMGISIFSGACTTLGASLFMFFAQILFFVRFGIFMFCTIGFSLLFSLGLFTTIMGAFGPCGKDGDVKYMFNTVCQYFNDCRKRKNSQKAIGKSS